MSRDFIASIKAVLDTKDLQTDLNNASKGKYITISNFKLDTSGLPDQIDASLKAHQFTINLTGIKTDGIETQTKLAGAKAGYLFSQSLLEKINEKIDSRQIEAKFQKLGAKTDKVIGSVGKLSEGTSKEALRGQYKELLKEYNVITSLYDKLKSNKLNDEEVISTYTQLEKAMTKYSNGLSALESSLVGVKSLQDELFKVEEAVSLRKNMEKWLSRNTGASEEYRNEVSRLIGKLKALEDVSSLDFSARNPKVEFGNIKKSFETLQNDLKEKSVEMGEKTSTSYIQSINDEISSGKIELIYSKVMEKYSQARKNLFKVPESSLKDIGAEGLAHIDEGFIKFQNLFELLESGNLEGQELIKTYHEFNKAVKELGNTADTVTSISKLTPSKEEIETLQSNMSLWLKKNPKAIKEYGVSIENLSGRLEDIKNNLNSFFDDDIQKEFASIKKDYNDIKRAAELAGKTGKTAAESFKSAFKSIGKYVSVSTLIFTMISAIKQGIQEIIKLDTALVDLKKTTDASQSQLESFYYTANDLAKELGITTEEVIQATSSWSRLGYSIKDAQELAKTTSIFSAISPGTDIEKATDGLVSAMKAFDIDANDALDEIASKVNAIGNTQAVENQDIIEILTRSSAAMREANNTLDETIALGTAGLEITRDAEAMGTALKTISLRIRGYDEETEEFIGDTAILEGEIANLTKTAEKPAGISLFTDESKETFKSTTQILRDISEIYDELTDKQQAQLLEKLAGKRQAQAVAAILGNFETVEKSLDTMKNSAGGALREMEIVQESLEYKLNALKETAVGVFQNLFTKEDMKLVIESLTEILRLVDLLTKHLGLFGTVSVSLGIYTLVKGFEDLALNVLEATGNTVGLTKVVLGLKGAFIGLGAVMKAHPVLTAITIATALIGIISAITRNVESATEKLSTLKSEIDGNSSEISKLNNELKTTNEKITELEKLEAQGVISFTDEEELERLKRENAERERKIKLLEEENRIKRGEVGRSFLKGVREFASADGTEFTGTLSSFISSVITKSISKSKVDIDTPQFVNLESLFEDYGKATDKEKEKLKKKIDLEIQDIAKLFENVEYIPNPQTEDEKRVNEWIDYFGLIIDKRDILFDEKDAQIDSFKRLSEINYADETESLRELGKVGKVTADQLADDKYKDFINDLIKVGFISGNTSEDLEKVARAFNDTGSSAKKASEGVGALSDSLQSLANIEKLSSGFDQLDKIYADILNKGSFDYSSIFNNESFKKAFGGLDSYEDFIRTIANTPDDINAVQSAFNNLTTEYIINSGVLNNLTEDNKKATIAMLEQMGIANASEIVSTRLAVEKEKLAYANKITETTTLDEAVAMVTEKNVSNEAKIAIAELALEKINVNKNTIQTSGDINNIIALANAANATAASLDRLEKAKEYKKKSEELNKLASQKGGVFTGGMMQKQMADRYALEAQALLSKPIEYEKFTVDDFKVDYAGGSTSQRELENFRKGVESSTKQAKADSASFFDFIEISFKKLERGIKNVERVAKSTYKSLSTRLGATKDEISLVTNEIEVQQQAYSRYMQQANAVGLSSGLAAKVRNGSIEITKYSESTQKLIKDYSDWYNKALDCADAVDELHENLASLYEDMFKNIQQDFDNQLGLLEHMTKSYETGLDMLEASGYLESSKYYTEMKNVQTQNIQVLEKELAQLEGAFSEAMASGEIEEYSEAWYSMQNDINGVKEEIAEANVELVELDKNLRELDWKYFDYTQDRISQLTSEANFLIKLMESSDMYDDKGKLSDEGMATLGLHGQNYNVYMAQADKYAQEILKINKELANDPYNVDLIERREELLKLQQDSILAAEDEKQAIKDLIENGIQEELNSLKELIDTYNKSLDSAKDLYEYQKKVEEQTKNIASLRKQLVAYEGDLSEETRAKVQKIEVELEKAEEELEETEYERYISDQKALLDELYLQYETILNERLDNIDALIEDVIGTINDNSTSISDTLDRVSSEVGYTMTDNMKTIWNDSVGSINGVVSKYGDNFTSQFTSINLVLNAIEAHTQAMVNASDAKAKETISSSNSKPVTKPSGGSKPAPKPAPKPSKPSTPPPKKVKVGGKINAGNALIYDYAGDPSGERQYYRRDPVYVVLDEQGGWVKVRHHKLKSGVTGWFKKSDIKAYKRGGLVNYTGLAQVDGTPGKPESFLNANDTKLLAKLTQTLSESANSPLLKSGAIGNTDLSDIIKLYKASNISNGSVLSGNNVTFGDTIINIDHVEDYNDLVSKMQKDKQFEKMITSMTVGRVMGKSELDKYKYKWR